MDVPPPVLDITRARSVLKWSPEMPLEEGLKHTWQWVKSLNLVDFHILLHFATRIRVHRIFSFTGLI